MKAHQVGMNGLTPLMAELLQHIRDGCRLAYDGGNKWAAFDENGKAKGRYAPNTVTALRYRGHIVPSKFFDPEGYGQTRPIEYTLAEQSECP